ncbi:MAG: MBL fold metallo-hydrolase, partial [Candidatus Izemoplasmatales bacterium]|nr:MBL fold metallo-hydrolase [Candidatus Izemoplasmatales bacterium]
LILKGETQKSIGVLLEYYNEFEIKRNEFVIKNLDRELLIEAFKKGFTRSWDEVRYELAVPFYTTITPEEEVQKDVSKKKRLLSLIFLSLISLDLYRKFFVEIYTKCKEFQLELVDLPFILYSLELKLESYETYSIVSQYTDQTNFDQIVKLARNYYNFNNIKTAYQIIESVSQYIQNVNDVYMYIEILYFEKKYQKALFYIERLMNSNKFYIKDKHVLYMQSKMKELISTRKIDEKIHFIIRRSHDEVQNHCNKNEKKLDRFLISRNTLIEGDYFYSFRRWNSYTPILSEYGDDSVGGGFFILTQGKGIVIDPGLNFLQNFRSKSEFSFDNIDAVVISHAHNDHTADLESILTLLYKYNKNLKDENERYTAYINENVETGFFDGIDKNIEHKMLEDSIIDNNPRKHETMQNKFGKHYKQIKLYINKSTLVKYSGMLNMLLEKTNYEIIVIEDNSVIKPFEDNPLKIVTFRNEHNDVISDYSSLGMLFVMSKTTILYSGDTKISQELIQRVQKLLDVHTTKKQKLVMLANLGG